MIRVFALTLLASLVAVASPPKQKTSTQKTVSSKSTHKSNLQPSSTARTAKSGSRSLSNARSSRSRARRARRPPAPSYQLHPDPERYAQIQQALTVRGYYKGLADGTWNDESVDALKRFQNDRKLEPDGKIDALTLSGLGLGPKHDGSSAATVPLSAVTPSAAPQPEAVFPSELPLPPAPPPFTNKPQ